MQAMSRRLRTGMNSHAAPKSKPARRATSSTLAQRASSTRSRGTTRCLPASVTDSARANSSAWADQIVATPDSVNMLSEACATGVPVHTASAAPLPDKLERFHAALRERGLLTESGTARTDVPPLRETQAIAAELRERMAARETSGGTSLRP